MRKLLFLLMCMSFLTCSSQKVADEVDLGLSVKWASHNIGAKKPQDYGWYLAWGEMSEKKYCKVENYKYRSQSLGDISGTNYDIAKQLWKGSWRLPTLNEAKELQEKCSWEWKEIGGVLGVQATGPNGNSIFFPAGGMKLNKTSEIGEKCNYWTGSEYKGFSLGEKDAWVMKVYNVNPKMSTDLAYNTFWGLLIRPVSESSGTSSKQKAPSNYKSTLGEETVPQAIKIKVLKSILFSELELEKIEQEHGKEVWEQIKKNPYKGDEYVFQADKHAPNDYKELFTEKIFTRAAWKNFENFRREYYHKKIWKLWENSANIQQVKSQEEENRIKKTLDAYAYRIADRFFIPNFKALFINNMYYEEEQGFGTHTVGGYIKESDFNAVLKELEAYINREK